MQMVLTRMTDRFLAFVICFWQSRVGKISRQQILTALSFGKLACRIRHLPC